MLFRQLTQLDPDYYLVLITSEHFQRTFSNSLPPAPHWCRGPHRRSVCRLPRRGPAAAADAARPASCRFAAAFPDAARGPAAGRRLADQSGLGSLGCWRRACACVHSGLGPLGCDVVTGWLSGNDCTLSAHPNQTVCTCGIYLMFVCLFSLHLHFVSLFVCFWVFVQVFIRFLIFTFPVGILFPLIAYVVDPCPWFFRVFCYISFLLDLVWSFLHSSLCLRHARL